MRTVTLLELCDMACQSIELRPNNYDQRMWAGDASGIGGCGTAFCRAGWMMAHVKAPKRTLKWCLDSTIASSATNLFLRAGVPWIDIMRLFGGGALSLLSHEPGTKEYAAAGATGFREFMAEHHNKLAATTVEIWEADDCNTGDTAHDKEEGKDVS